MDEYDWQEGLPDNAWRWGKGRWCSVSLSGMVPAPWPSHLSFFLPQQSTMIIIIITTFPCSLLSTNNILPIPGILNLFYKRFFLSFKRKRYVYPYPSLHFTVTVGTNPPPPHSRNLMGYLNLYRLPRLLKSNLNGVAHGTAAVLTFLMGTLNNGVRACRGNIPDNS